LGTSKAIANRLAACVAASVFLFAGSATVLAQPDLVSSDVNGQLLVEPNTTSSVYHLEDITPDGRYALFSSRETCTLYRKNRQTGELLTVLENTLADSTDGSGYSWCNGAGISADGNLVAASPTQNLGEPELVSTDPFGGELYSFGDVVVVARKNIATGEVEEVTREYTGNPNDIARINGCCYASQFRELSADGDTALVSDIATAFGFGLPAPVTNPSSYKTVSIDAQTITTVRLPLDANLDVQPVISQATMSSDGSQLLLHVATVIPNQLPDPRIQPGGPTGPDSVIICGQLGRCDDLGTLPDDCGPTGGSWRCFGYPPNDQLDQLVLYATDNRATRTVYTRDIDSNLSMGPIALAGDGEFGFFVLTDIRPNCFIGEIGEVPTPCPGYEEAPADLTPGLKRLTLDNSAPDTNVEDLPSVCDNVAPLSATQCMHLSAADNGNRILIGLGQRFVQTQGPITGPLPGLYPPIDPEIPALCEYFNDPLYCERDVGLNLPGDNGYFPYSSPPLYSWYLTNAATGHNERVSIFDGALYEASRALLAGNGADWAFTSAYGFISFDSTPAFHEGAVYADSAGKNLDLSVVTRRVRRQAGDTGTRLKTIVSNYGATSANLVTVDFIMRKWTRNGNTSDPTVSLDYDDCNVYDNTHAGSKTLLLLDGGKLQKVNNHYVLRCAIGLIEPGQRFTLDWQISDDSNAPKFIRAHVDGNEADSSQRNNRSWTVVTGRGPWWRWR